MRAWQWLPIQYCPTENTGNPKELGGGRVVAELNAVPRKIPGNPSGRDDSRCKAAQEA